MTVWCHLLAKAPAEILPSQAVGKTAPPGPLQPSPEEEVIGPSPLSSITSFLSIQRCHFYRTEVLDLSIIGVVHDNVPPAMETGCIEPTPCSPSPTAASPG